jgi:hypothetical protein
MSPVARGNLTRILVLLLFAGVLLATGCVGTEGAGSSPAPTTGQAMPATAPFTTSPVRTLPSTVAPTRVTDLSLPPPKATPAPAPSVDPIVGTWYAPPPDDLTFEFFPDGTFTERSPNFRTYSGTWGISEEAEAGFYDASVLDQWGYKKQVHILITSGTLYIKSMGTLHRVG